MTPTPFLHIAGLRKAFDGQVVLDGVDLAVERGTITTVMGKSGIGKSVLLKCIAGIHQPDAGEILLQGSPCIGAHCGHDAPKLSYLFQNNALFDSMTAAENVAVPLIEVAHVGRREARRRVLALFEKLDLDGVADKYPAQISGGMQKRVGLARALITEPQLILFDEPTTGLDPQRKNSVFEMVAEYRARFDFTALMVCHDIPEALFVSDRVAWLDRGQIRFFGPPTELEGARDPDLLDFIHHRNHLLGAVAGQRDRGDLFADWARLRAVHDRFVVVSCQTERRRPGSELGLRRFAQFRAAAERLAGLRWTISPVYLLDERHFGFAVTAGVDPDETVEREIDGRLRDVATAGSGAWDARYRWEPRVHSLADLPRPEELWAVNDTSVDYPRADPFPAYELPQT